MGKINYSEIQNNGSSIFLKVETGKTLQVRLIGKPVEVYKIFHNGNRACVCEEVANEIHKQHPEIYQPRATYALNVINRADGKIKILEAPTSVFTEFRKRFEVTGKDPGGLEGGDWKLTAEGTGINKRYITVFIDKTPFTEEELETAKAHKGNEKDNFLKYYEEDTLEEALSKLFGDKSSDEKGSEDF